MGAAAKIGRASRAHLSGILSRTMIRARQAVTDATPVDTEHARSNWILSLGRPFVGVDGSRDAVSYTAQLAGDDLVRGYDIGRDGPKIFLRNNVFYIQFLNKGHSQQADPNFIADALQAGAAAAPHGSKTAVRKLLRHMARVAYTKGF